MVERAGRDVCDALPLVRLESVTFRICWKTEQEKPYDEARERAVLALSIPPASRPSRGEWETVSFLAQEWKVDALMGQAAPRASHCVMAVRMSWNSCPWLRVSGFGAWVCQPVGAVA